MEYVVAGLIFAVALFFFLWGFWGSLKRSQNRAFSVLTFFVWVVAAGILSIKISPFFVFMPLVAHIPTLVIGQGIRYTPTGYWGQVADMGALAVLAIAYFAIVWLVCGWVVTLYDAI